MESFKCSLCHYEGQNLMELLNHLCSNGPSQAAASSTLYFVPEQPSKSSQPTGSSALYFVSEEPGMSPPLSQSSRSSAFSFVPEDHSTSAAVFSTSTQKNSSTNSDKLDRWEDKDVRLLITCWADHQHMFGGKATKKDIFHKIAKAFNEKAQRSVSGEQCMRKWAKLVAKHKEVKDHNNLTGESNKKWKYSDEMSACLENNAAVSPVITIESPFESSAESECQESHVIDEGNDSSPAESDINSDSDSSSSKSSGKKKKTTTKRQRKKRKSRSSAAEMIDFLKEYSDRREKAEAEKLKLFKEMKEEKKNFFDKFFDVMERKG